MNDASRRVRWSIVIPYFNEEAYIERTIACAVALTGPAFRLILVDNASDDSTKLLCRWLLARHPHIDVTYVDEARPGPSHALEAGLAHVETPLVALWNADTLYPADYLTRADSLLSEPGTVAAMAFGLRGDPRSLYGRITRHHKRLVSLVMRGQSHTGTFGQCFRTNALRAAGGPRSEAWPWVLDDHELMHRVLKLGRSRYSADFWCRPSDRRANCSHVRWSLAERLLYHATPFAAKDWFFYDFLARRFAERGMANANLRCRDWEQQRMPAARGADPKSRASRGLLEGADG